MVPQELQGVLGEENSLQLGSARSAQTKQCMDWVNRRRGTSPREGGMKS